MKLVVKCPSCDACGEVPDQFIGLRIRCMTCATRFVLGSRELVMTPIKSDRNTVLEYDSIELVACAKCPSLGVLINHHASRFYRCPDCKALCTVDGGLSLMPRGTVSIGDERSAGPSPMAARAAARVAF
jgi:hypothetical protein